MADRMLMNLNDTTPAAPADRANIHWHVTGRTVTATVPLASATTPGLIRLPPIDGKKYIMLNGNWTEIV